MANPYSISLLNDLHHYFPDLLYRPQRFSNVQDVLQYIIDVANQNPYQREQAAYTRQTTQSMNLRPRATASATSYFNINTIADMPTRILSSGLVSRQLASNRILDDFIAELYSSVPNNLRPEQSASLPSFLNDRVIVRPTEAQIEAGSTILTANQLNQDNCAICQDPMEIGQNIRMLRHCTHRFHQECIDTWFQQHVTCPTCRHDIRDQNDEV